MDGVCEVPDCGAPAETSVFVIDPSTGDEVEIEVCEYHRDLHAIGILAL